MGEQIEVKDMDSGEQRPAESAEQAVQMVEEMFGVKAPRPNRYRTHWAGELRAGRGRAAGRAWPAGCIAGATTAA